MMRHLDTYGGHLLATTMSVVGHSRPANSGPGRIFMMGLPYILGGGSPHWLSSHGHRHYDGVAIGRLGQDLGGAKNEGWRSSSPVFTIFKSSICARRIFHIGPLYGAGNLSSCRCSFQECAATPCNFDSVNDLGWDPRMSASVISGARNANRRTFRTTLGFHRTESANSSIDW